MSDFTTKNFNREFVAMLFMLSLASARSVWQRMERILQIERTAFTRHERSSHPIVRKKERNPAHKESMLKSFRGCVKTHTFAAKSATRPSLCVDEAVDISTIDLSRAGGVLH